MNGIVTHWVIIIESFVERNNQRQFRQTYEHVKHRHERCKIPLPRLYAIKFIQFVAVATFIQVFFLSYYLSYVGNKWYFRIVYLFSQIMYQYRVFYYLFYLEMIKFELKTIKRELNDITKLSNFHDSFEMYIDIISNGHGMHGVTPDSQ